MRILAGMILAIVIGPAALADEVVDDPAALARIDDATLDAQFRCPETLVTADGRLDEIERYYVWARARHPDWNMKKRLDVRYGLLRRHACTVTLRNVASSVGPAFRP
jgi:hypothetical protein